MIAYVLRRLALAVSMVWAISFGAFFAFGLSFDPTYQFNLCTTAGCREQRQALIDAVPPPRPDPRAVLALAQGAVHGRLRTHGAGHFSGGDPRIGPALWSAAAVTAQLIAVSLVLVVVLSVVVGVVSARWQGSPLDMLLRLLAYVTWSLPAFLVGRFLWRWLEPTGWFYGGRPGGGLAHWIRTMTLPAVTLALGLIGVYSRYVRTAMADALRQPYAVVARAKGLTERRVVLRHALRNSLIPFVSVLSLEFAAVVGASLAVDYVFGMGGLALLFLHSLGEADPFAMTAILVVIGGIVAVFMFLSDLAVGWLDPRARVAAAAR